jgi:hypothetical protein
VQELHRLGQLVVDLEHDGGDEQHDEPEVDERVHRTGSRVAQQRLHPHAGAEVLEPLLHVALVRAAVVGRAALVVAHPQGDQPRRHEEHDAGGRVEGPVERVGDAAEDLAGDGRVVVPTGQPGDDTRRDRAQRGEHTDAEDQLMRLGTWWSPHGPESTRRVANR